MKAGLATVGKGHQGGVSHLEGSWDVEAQGGTTRSEHHWL